MPFEIYGPHAVAPPPAPRKSRTGVAMLLLALGLLIGMVIVGVRTAMNQADRPPAVPDESLVLTAPEETSTDPFGYLAALPHGDLNDWLDKQAAHALHMMQRRKSYQVWESWYYHILQHVSTETLWLATTESMVWWLNGTEGGDYELRFARQFTEPDAGTLCQRMPQPTGSETLLAGKITPSSDGHWCIVRLQSSNPAEQGELRILEAIQMATPVLQLPLAPEGNVVWLPDSSGFWYDAPSSSPNISFPTLQMLPGKPAGGGTLSYENYKVANASQDQSWLVLTHQRDLYSFASYVRPITAALNAPLITLWDQPNDIAWGDFAPEDPTSAYLLVSTHEREAVRLVRVSLNGVMAEEEILIDQLPDRPHLLAVGETHLAVLTSTGGTYTWQRYRRDGTAVDAIPWPADQQPSLTRHPALGTTVRLGTSGLLSAWQFVDFDPDSGEMTQIAAAAGAFFFRQPEVALQAVPTVDGELLQLRLLGTEVSRPPTQSRPTILWLSGGSQSTADDGPLWLMAPWVDAGGVWATVEVRGSGTRGRAWREAGLGANRALAVADVLTAVHWLESEGITSAKQLGLAGISHGGWLALQAGLTEPAATSAILAISPVTDLTALTDTSLGSWWVQEFGDPGDPATLDYLPTLSPYVLAQTVRQPPACFLMVARDETMVPPMQSYKLAAALQRRSVSPPALLFPVPVGGNRLLHGTENDWDLFNSALTFAGIQLGLTPEF